MRASRQGGEKQRQRGESRGQIESPQQTSWGPIGRDEHTKDRKEDHKHLEECLKRQKEGIER